MRYKLFLDDHLAAVRSRRFRLRKRKPRRTFRVPYCDKHARQWRIGIVIIGIMVLAAVLLAIWLTLLFSTEIVGDTFINDSSENAGGNIGFSILIIFPLGFILIRLSTWLATLILARIFESFRDFDVFQLLKDHFQDGKSKHRPGFHWIRTEDVFIFSNRDVAREFARLNSLSSDEGA